MPLYSAGIGHAHDGHRIQRHCGHKIQRRASRGDDVISLTASQRAGGGMATSQSFKDFQSLYGVVARHPELGHVHQQFGSVQLWVDYVPYLARKEGRQWLRSSRADTYFGSNHVAETLIGEQIQALTEIQMSHQYEGTKFNKKPISNVFRR